MSKAPKQFIFSMVIMSTILLSFKKKITLDLMNLFKWNIIFIFPNLIDISKISYVCIILYIYDIPGGDLSNFKCWFSKYIC